MKELRDKGVSDFHLANFLGCRAVKLPLLPLMAAYFGWLFTVLISAIMIVDAVIVALAVSARGASGDEL